jgi:hypothetical protein
MAEGDAWWKEYWWWWWWDEKTGCGDGSSGRDVSKGAALRLGWVGCLGNLAA